LSWLWLFALGLLGYRSGMLPSWLSFLLMFATVCYVIDALTRFLAPSLADTSAAVFLLPEITCEVALLGYLLVKGVRQPLRTVQGPTTS
jgi:antibiotic biosynthesis monooxygenase (ABM) superfamily enzyme